MNIKELLLENNINFKSNVSLAQYTTMRVGGLAAFLIETHNGDELKKALILAEKNNLHWLLLGKGSNVIISDMGFDGLVIINKADSWKIISQKSDNCSPNQRTASRLDKTEKKKKYNQPSFEKVLVRVDSGVLVTSFAQKLYKKGITGLEWFAGIPATVGGALYMNMHGGHYFFGDLLVRAKVIKNNKCKIVDFNYFKFDYDYSILHNTKEMILWAELCLTMGDIDRAKETFKECVRQKAFQPQRSAGCVFKNLSIEEKKKKDLPSQSIGYIIDNVLKLKGYKIGGAIISPKHAAFIENTGTATATDIFLLTEVIIKTAREKLNLELKLEIEFIGNF